MTTNDSESKAKDDKVDYPDWEEFHKVEARSQAFLIGLYVHTCAEIHYKATEASADEYIVSFKSLPSDPQGALRRISEKVLANAVPFTAKGWSQWLLNMKAKLRVLVGDQIPKRLTNQQCNDYTLGLDAGRVYGIECWKARQAAKNKKKPSLSSAVEAVDANAV